METPPPNYEQAALVAKGNLLDRQVVVRKAQDADADQLASLTERELVENASVALELMGIAASDRPTGMKFIGYGCRALPGQLFQLGWLNLGFENSNSRSVNTSVYCSTFNVCRCISVL